MADTKPFASLSSGLLARKGTAKPAMRPQGFGQMGVSLDDLGWNDMGYSQDAPAAAYAPTPEPTQVVKPIAALTIPARAPEEAPAVVEQQRAIEASFAPEAKKVRTPRARRAVKAVAARRERAAAGSKAKTAFTLRLDAERHLKLRLACALKNCSAQQIVTEALDELLNGLPELNGVARQAAGKRN